MLSDQGGANPFFDYSQQSLKRVNVASPAQASYVANDNWRDDGFAPTFFSGLNIRDVHFDCGEPTSNQCVCDGIRIHPKCTRIDDYAISPVCGCLDYVDDLAFHVRLKYLQLGAILLR